MSNSFEGQFIVHHIPFLFSGKIPLDEFMNHYIDSYCITGISNQPLEWIVVLESLDSCTTANLGLSVYLGYSKRIEFIPKQTVTFNNLTTSKSYYSNFDSRKSALKYIANSVFALDHPDFMLSKNLDPIDLKEILSMREFGDDATLRF